MKYAYYNEWEPYAAEWLRRLIRAGHIAPGYVDERSILDVSPDDLAEFGQCHFFSGLGGWSLALRLAGISDEEPVWTGSCPCQPFSVAGKGGGLADERHLWPAFHWLIDQRRPHLVFGEQVSSPDGRAWLDGVQTDLEGSGYASGAVVAPAAGVGAYHQRHRLYWVADSNGGRYSRIQREGDPEFHHDRTILRSSSGSERGGLDSVLADTTGRNPSDGNLQRGGKHGLQPQGRRVVGVAEPDEVERRRLAEHDDLFGDRPPGGRQQSDGEPSGRGDVEFVADDDDERLEGRRRAAERGAQRPAGPGSVADELADADFGARRQGRALDGGRHHRSDEVERTGFGGGGAFDGARSGALDRPWRDADWLLCRDSKWRPVGPGTQPLVDGLSFKLGSGSPYAGKSRSGMLRAAGNAIVPQQAAEFVKAYLDIRRTVEAERPVRIDDLFG